jgi:WD40 repeat protein
MSRQDGVQRLLSSRQARTIVLAASPIVGTLVAVLTNLITTRWNWWLFFILVLGVVVLAVAAVLVGRLENLGATDKDAVRVPVAVPAGPTLASPADNSARGIGGPDHLQRAPDRAAHRPSMVPPRSGRFVDRPELMAALIQKVLNHPTGGGPVALCGTGGFGKSTIAEELCRRPEIAARFPDGDLWVTIGQLSSDAALTSKINDLSFVLSRERPAISDPNLAGYHLGELLSGSSKLLVIDDVWDFANLYPFLLGGPNCLRLVTTRNRSTLPDDAVVVTVDAMERAEARQLLLSGLGDVPQQPVDRVLNLTGHWAVLLGLVNGAARGYADGGESASGALDRVARQLLESGPEAFDMESADDRRRAVAVSVQASVRLLHPDEEKRYTELAVFPEDVEIPVAVLSRYWQASGGLDEAAVDRLCRRLADLSLVMYYRQSPSRIRLHDVIWSYLRRRSLPTLPAMNSTLLGAVGATLPAGQQAGERAPWWLLAAGEEYLWDWLGYHLHEAGRADELQALVHDLRYLARKIQLRGSVAAEADLALSADPLSEAVRGVVSQDAHLFEGAGFESGVAATLVNRLETVPGTAEIVADFVHATGTSYLRNRWPPPDSPDPALRRVLAGHTGAVYACTVEPNGTWLASGGTDGDVHVWDGESGRMLRVIHAHEGTVWRCEASPDGAWLLTVGDDGWVRTWDVESGEERGGRKISDNPVFACAMSPDGSWIATSGDGPVRIWDARTLELRQTLEGNTGPVWGGCAVSADGNILAAGGSDGAVRVWTMPAGDLRHVLMHPTAVWDCAVFPDGRLLATARSEGLILLWDLESGQIVREAYGHVGPVQACELSADGTWLVSAGADYTVRIWDAKSGELRKLLEGHTGQVWECALPARGTWLATAAGDSTVRIWALPSAAQAAASHERRPTLPVWACAAPRSGQWLANSSDDGTVRIWDVPSGRERRLLSEHMGPIWACAAPDDGRWLAIAGGNGTALIWDTETAQTRQVLAGHDGPIWSCAAPGNGEWLATAGEDRLVRIWNVADGELRHVIEDHSGPVAAVAASPSGDWLATAGADGSLNLWTASGGRLCHLVDRRQEVAWACAPLNAGAWLATAGADGAVRIWDVADGKLLQTLKGHAGPVWACAASPSGEWLATTGRDRTVRVWRPGSGEESVTGIRLGSYGRACCWVGAGLDLCVGADAGTYLFSLVVEPET